MLRSKHSDSDFYVMLFFVFFFIFLLNGNYLADFTSTVFFLFLLSFSSTSFDLAATQT